MELVVIVMMLALVEFMVFGLQVGMARGRTGVEAPAVAGNEEFERYFRVHYNTMEQLILFIPGVWFFAQTVHVYGAVGLGVVYLIGRAIYAISYVKDPATRTAGTLLSMFPCWILVLGALGGAAWNLISG